MTTKKLTISVRYNIWGNYACYVGRERTRTFANITDATFWVADKLQTGDFKLSATSYVLQQDVDSLINSLNRS